MDPIRVFIGFDQREAVAYHVCCQSIIENCSAPISFFPLLSKNLGFDGRRDGSNEFIYSRFLVPYLTDFKGWALYLDGDMLVKGDLADLWASRDGRRAVQVVKHDYKTKFPIKYLGSRNEDYPRKNWSSVILWNCANPGNKVLTPEYVQNAPGSLLHRFGWLGDDRIGELEQSWNWLVEEYPHNDQAKLLHYTVGSPCFPEFKDCDHSADWRAVHVSASEPLYRR